MPPLPAKLGSLIAIEGRAHGGFGSVKSSGPGSVEDPQLKPGGRGGIIGPDGSSIPTHLEDSKACQRQPLAEEPGLEGGQCRLDGRGRLGDRACSSPRSGASCATSLLLVDRRTAELPGAPLSPGRARWPWASPFPEWWPFASPARSGRPPCTSRHQKRPPLGSRASVSPWWSHSDLHPCP